MKRIGITQRVEFLENCAERRDCLDQAWTVLFERLGWDLLPISNAHGDVIDWARRQQLDGLLLSGGNDLCHLPGASRSASERDATETALLHWAQLSQIPVLGVCRGMQIINCFLGGILTKVTGHVACRHSLLACNGVQADGVLARYDKVNSFHDWGVAPEGLATGLMPLLQAEDDSIELFQHTTLPWCGIMWHPEREEESAIARDQQLLFTFFDKKTWLNDESNYSSCR